MIILRVFEFDVRNTNNVDRDRFKIYIHPRVNLGYILFGVVGLIYFLSSPWHVPFTKSSTNELLIYYFF